MTQASRRPASRRAEMVPRAIAAAVSVVVLLVGLTLAARPAPALAHAALVSSDPPMDAVLPVAPSQVTMVFAERLEPSGSEARLFDSAGTQVDGVHVAITGPKTMVLSLPAGLPNGTWLVVWTTLSSDDGHAATGYISFTIGTNLDVAAVVLPPLTSDSAPTAWQTAAARWVTYVGLAILVGLWPVWLVAVRPPMRAAWVAIRPVARRLRWLVWTGLILALAGSVSSFLLQAATAPGPYREALRTTLTDTRFGYLWLARVVALVALAVALARFAPWGRPARHPWPAGALLALSIVPVIPFGLLSHADAQDLGRAAAVANDVIHAVAASIWLGGIVLLAVVALPLVRSGSTRSGPLGAMVARFSTVALAAWLVIVTTGMYQALLEVGNLTALTTTTYGRTLVVKVAVAVVILAVAAVNFLVVGPRMRARAGDSGSSAVVGLFRGALIVELVLGLAVMAVTGSLTQQQPARDVMAERSGQIVLDLDLGGRRGTLGIAPGSSGVNHFQLRLEGEPVPQDSRVQLRLAMPTVTSDDQTIDLHRIASDTWEWHGGELAVPGDWQLTVVLRQAGQEDQTQRLTLTVPAVPNRLDVPGAPPRFEPVGITAFLLIVAGLIGLVVAVRLLRGQTRMELGGLAGVGMMLGAFLLIQGQVNPAYDAIPASNPIPADPGSIAAGEQLWQTTCLVCHGAGGKGDGPQAGSLAISPPDLTSGHQRFHSDRDTYYAISNGETGSGMPAYGDRLSADDIWNLVNYIHALQDGSAPATAATATPGAALEKSRIPASGPHEDGSACYAAIEPVCLHVATGGPIVNAPAFGGFGKAAFHAVASPPVDPVRRGTPIVIAGLRAGSCPGAIPCAGVPPGGLAPKRLDV